MYNLDCFLVILSQRLLIRESYEPQHDKSNKMICAPSEDANQPGHPPRLNKVFAFRMKKHWVLSYPLSAQRRLWSDWADAQADMSLCRAHMPFCWLYHAAAHISCSLCVSGICLLLFDILNNYTDVTFDGIIWDRTLIVLKPKSLLFPHNWQ